MHIDPFAAPSRVTVDLTYYFNAIAETLDWGSPAWVTLESKLRTDIRTSDQLTMGEILKAISSTRCDATAKPGTQVHRLIGANDPSRHEVFRAIRKLLRIYDLRIVELLALIDVIERCPGNVEDMSIKNLLALISLVDLEEVPIAPLAPPPSGSGAPAPAH
ncbi:hypothetical protein PDM28_12975 [Stenotrophomonas aracearum]|jgi:hypothetical protein|uniref:Uncharacterized protein n=1 Tax=Stenotrophomonas aracearum TaxID=3003272 RepID=A0ABY9Y9R9_9GAMM|nr:hypothetical protein [Stenotrophomonas sp. A5588]WNH47597.1 hypothetical protein PDM28_12975 [Stenotrophomonas sp. A5588]